MVDPGKDAVREQYERWVYPEPIADLGNNKLWVACCCDLVHETAA